jgi:flagellar hook-associated protein 1 FlgK
VSGSKIVATAQASGTNPAITASGTGLASQRLTLTDLPDEELIVFLSEGGARRLLTQYDEAPAGTPKPMRDLEIRVKDAVNKTIEVVDTETATSISTRILDDENSALLEGFKVTFDGALLDGDKFSITGNTSGIGDNRNLQAILQLQHGPSGNDTSGAFQKVYNNAISRLGSLVQSGQLASEAATSLKEASIEAESAYSGVNLDAEAANLIQQQQAYQASARILSTARELFETLIQTL